MECVYASRLWYDFDLEKRREKTDSMATLAMFYGIIIKMNRELGTKHHDELFANWDLLREGDTFFRIEPLR